MSDNYAFSSKEKLCQKAIKLLCDTVLCADINSKGLYIAIMKDIRDNILEDEDINSDSVSRAFEELFSGTVASINHANSTIEFKNISFADVKDFYKQIVEHAEICVFGVGDYNEDEVLKYFKARFSIVTRKLTHIPNSLILLNAIEPRDVCKTHESACVSSLTVAFNLGLSKLSARNVAIATLYASFLEKELYFKVRDIKGFVYSLQVCAFVGMNTLVFSCNVTRPYFREVIFEIKSVMEGFYFSPFAKKQFMNEKERLKSDLRSIDKPDFIKYIELCHIWKINEDVIDKISFNDFIAFCESFVSNKNYIGSYFEEEA